MTQQTKLENAITEALRARGGSMTMQTTDQTTEGVAPESQRDSQQRLARHPAKTVERTEWWVVEVWEDVERGWVRYRELPSRARAEAVLARRVPETDQVWRLSVERTETTTEILQAEIRRVPSERDGR